MADENKIVSRQNGSNETVELLPVGQHVPVWEFSQREPHLNDYLLVVRKHKWMVLSFMLAVVTIVAIGNFRMLPVYVATARIEIDRENPNLLPFQPTDSYDYMMDTDNYLETQARILTSETLALQTLRNTSLSTSPESSSPNEMSEAVASGTLANQKRPPELGQFLESLNVKRVPNTRLMDASFESSDPQLAARIVNVHIATFIEQNLRSKYEATAEASTWLGEQLSELKIKVQKAEDARIAYERRNQIWTLDDKQNITTQRLSDINRQLTDAQSERMKKESLYKFAQSGNLDAVPQVQGALNDLLKKRGDAASAYMDALNQYGPNFPKVQRLKAQLKEFDDTIEKEKQKILAVLESDYREAGQRENLLLQALDQQKTEANQMAEKLVEYNILKREAEANKTLYDGLMTKLKETAISQGLRSSNIRVVDPAMIPTSPARPAKARNLALACLVGLVGGIGLAFLREYLDNTVKTPDDVETLVRLPSLAVVPQFADSNGTHKLRSALPRFSSNGQEWHIELFAQHLPKSAISEAFRALRTSILLSQADCPPQVILVSSPLPREGKTTAAANLAVTLAQLGDRTMLVDADLRKPGIARVLNLGSSKYSGLSSYLAGVSSLDLVSVPHPTISNLVVIPTGPLPPNPADLLSSHKLAEAIAELRTKFKFIVIDSPPIMAATDAVILSVQADGVLLVVRSGETPKEAFMRASDLLKSVKCRVLGVVLNAVNANAPDYYYSYRYYPYSYGYGPQETGESTQSETLDSGSEVVSRYHHDDDDSEAL